MIESWMRSCKHCRHFEAGECGHPDMTKTGDSNFENIIDDGLISAAIEETLPGINEKELDTVESAVIRVLRNNLEQETIFEIREPGAFHCSHWD